jgi:predicted RecB family nuclease
MTTFSAQERAVLLAVKGVGPTVVTRLEQMGIASLKTLAKADASTICSEAAGLTGGTCWKNSPIARKAITSAIDAAQRATAKAVKARSQA